MMIHAGHHSRTSALDPSWISRQASCVWMTMRSQYLDNTWAKVPLIFCLMRIMALKIAWHHQGLDSRISKDVERILTLSALVEAWTLKQFLWPGHICKRSRASTNLYWSAQAPLTSHASIQAISLISFALTHPRMVACITSPQTIDARHPYRNRR